MRGKEETITTKITQVILKLKHWINITQKETNIFISNIKYIKKQKTNRNKRVYMKNKDLKQYCIKVTKKIDSKNSKLLYNLDETCYYVNINNRKWNFIHNYKW